MMSTFAGGAEFAQAAPKLRKESPNYLSGANKIVGKASRLATATNVFFLGATLITFFFITFPRDPLEKRQK
jgi:hypothetical protein